LPRAAAVRRDRDVGVDRAGGPEDVYVGFAGLLVACISPLAALDDRVCRAEELLREARQVALNLSRRRDGLRATGLVDLDLDVLFAHRLAALLDHLRIGHEAIHGVDVLCVVDRQIRHLPAPLGSEEPNTDAAKIERLGAEEGVQNYLGYREIDDEPEDVDNRGNEGSGGHSWIESCTPNQKWQ